MNARGGITRWVHRLSGAVGRRPRYSQPADVARSIIWNDSQDTRYAHGIPELQTTLHIFSQEWIGIRAAAGSLSGSKLAISAEAPVSHACVRAVVAEVERQHPKRIVFHGMSYNMYLVATALSARGMRDSMYAVMHGAPAQWFSRDEYRFSEITLELAAKSVFRRIHVMKSGFEFPITNLYRPMLFNLSPAGVRKSLIEESKKTRVLLPGWAGWRKNVHTNALAACLAPSVDEVLVYANDIRMPWKVPPKLRHVEFVDRESTFALIAVCTALLNVSLVDCHPMANIEAQSLGVPVLRGPLFLDALENHIYVQLTNVNDPTSVGEIKEKLSALTCVPKTEIGEITLDYQNLSDKIAVQRYLEFLEL